MGDNHKDIYPLKSSQIHHCHYLVLQFNMHLFLFPSSYYSAEGLDPILELEDVLRSKVPEPKSLITYVHSIYQHFHDKAEKAKLEQEQAAW